MSAKESSAWRRDYEKPTGHKPASAPADPLGPIVGSSKTAERFDRSPVAQLVERLTVNPFQLATRGNQEPPLGALPDLLLSYSAHFMLLDRRPVVAPSVAGNLQ